jgi:hypothetical protein
MKITVFLTASCNERKRRGVDAAIFVDVPCRASGVGYAARDAISGCLDAAQCQGSSVCSS